jgi:hypothetical protein
MAQSAAAKEQKRLLMKAWRESNQERIKAYQKEWRAKNAELVKGYQKAYQAGYQRKPGVQHEKWVRNLRRNYQMTPEQFNELWATQNGKCGVCEVLMNPRGRDKDAACVDHNHATGEVRGLLCRGCNHGIGNLKDCPEVLEAAAQYLRSKGHYSTSLIVNRG